MTFPSYHIHACYRRSYAVSPVYLFKRALASSQNVHRTRCRSLFLGGLEPYSLHFSWRSYAFTTMHRLSPPRRERDPSKNDLYGEVSTLWALVIVSPCLLIESPQGIVEFLSPDPLSTFPICFHARILPLIIFLAGVWIPSVFVRAEAFSLTQIGGGVLFQTESWAHSLSFYRKGFDHKLMWSGPAFQESISHHKLLWKSPFIHHCDKIA